MSWPATNAPTASTQPQPTASWRRCVSAMLHEAAAPALPAWRHACASSHAVPAPAVAQGGELLCCDGCNCAFHTECVNLQEVPTVRPAGRGGACAPTAGCPELPACASAPCSRMAGPWRQCTFQLAKCKCLFTRGRLHQADRLPSSFSTLPLCPVAGRLVLPAVRAAGHYLQAGAASAAAKAGA